MVTPSALARSSSHACTLRGPDVVTTTVSPPPKLNSTPQATRWRALEVAEVLSARLLLVKSFRLLHRV